jgi:hypothetical protein
MPRKQKVYHFIYKTTCLITNKFYIGMHSTNNLEDGYLGSGKRLWYSLNKYGRENHKLERLEFFDTRKQLRYKEIEIVNEDLIKNPLCMNLKEGGDGGFVNEEHRKKCTIAGLKSQWSNPEYIKWHKDRQKIRFIEMNKSRLGLPGKKHSEETKAQMSLKHKGHTYQKGEKNSQYGTRWITNGIKIKKLHKEESLPNGWRYGKTLSQVND